MKNEFLEDKEEKIEYLISNCKNKKEEDLIYFLLEKLVFIDSKKYNRLLRTMVDYIEDLKLDFDSTQIVSITMDDEADSGQTVLQAIKGKLFEREIKGFKTVNNFNKSVQYYNKQGKTNIIVVDELIGSGRTVRNRIKTFNDRIIFEKDYNFYFVFVAGVEDSINKLKAEGLNVFCAYPLKRGLADNFIGEELESKYSTMLEMELRLSQKINDKDLYDYSLGYGGAEVLYTAEECLSNTPNSVFPLFWWIKDIDDKKRNTLLTRYESGF